MRIAFWDLETSDLKADVGRLLIGSIMDESTGAIKTFRRDQYPKRAGIDVKLAKDIRDELERFHLHCAWFGKGFDISFLRSRLVQAGERPLKKMWCIDPCFAMKGWHGLSPRSASLKVAAEFFNLPERKMDVPVEVWVRAMEGDRAAMKILAERCESDVRILKQVTDKLLDAGMISNIKMF